jgi:hypothetical protein
MLYTASRILLRLHHTPDADVTHASYMDDRSEKYMFISTRDTRGRWTIVRPAVLLLLLAAHSTHARVSEKSAPLSRSQALNARQWTDAPVVPGRLCPTSSVLGEFVRRHKLRTPPADFNNGAQGGAGNAWMQRNWEPHLRCVGEMRLGQAGDGGKHVCDPDCLLERNACLVYSFGSNNDFGFETSVLPYGCAIHVFDHTGPCTRVLRLQLPGNCRVRP